jgi:hypothetical protein
MSTAREGETEALTARMNEIDLLPEDERDAELTNHRASTGFVVLPQDSLWMMEKPV